MDDLKRKNVDTLIFSCLHSSGEKLNSLTGIAAILRFPMELDDEEMEESDSPIIEDFRTKFEDRINKTSDAKTSTEEQDKLEAMKILDEMKSNKQVIDDGDDNDGDEEDVTDTDYFDKW